MDYNKLHAKDCLSRLPQKPKKILIIGCGSQCEDVKAFYSELNGDVTIHGVDIVDDIGSAFENDNILYIKADATELPLHSEYYDLAYSFATFEHIMEPGKAWQCMINALKPGGFIWSVASPLWTSPYGHHKSDIFSAYPFAHLLYESPEDLYKFCIAEDIKSNDSTDIIHHVRFMLDDRYFNKLNPSRYIEDVKNLHRIEILKNECDRGPESLLERPIAKELISLGKYSEEDLLSTTHRFIGIKQS